VNVAGRVPLAVSKNRWIVFLFVMGEPHSPQIEVFDGVSNTVGTEIVELHKALVTTLPAASVTCTCSDFTPALVNVLLGFWAVLVKLPVHEYVKGELPPVTRDVNVTGLPTTPSGAEQEAVKAVTTST
jgi:hypothetical protein